MMLCYVALWSVQSCRVMLCCVVFRCVVLCCIALSLVLWRCVAFSSVALSALRSVSGPLNCNLSVFFVRVRLPSVPFGRQGGSAESLGGTFGD